MSSSALANRHLSPLRPHWCRQLVDGWSLHIETVCVYLLCRSFSRPTVAVSPLGAAVYVSRSLPPSRPHSLTHSPPITGYGMMLSLLGPSAFCAPTRPSVRTANGVCDAGDG
eukprot:393824-Rhodomonas_salina.2